MITKLQVKTTIYGAFYRIVRVGKQPSMEEFYKKTVKETWPKTQPPADFPDFWWESVALEIQNGFIARKSYLNGLDGAWLKQRIDKTWQSILDYAVDNVEALGEVLKT